MRQRIRYERLLPLFVFLLGVLLPAQQEAEAPRPRVAVIGASVSNGFSSRMFLALQTPGGDPRRVSEKFLEAEISEAEYERRTEGLSFRQLLGPILKERDLRLIDYSNSMFFQDPAEHAERQVSSVLKRDAQLVVGIDFLFWFVYGPRHVRVDASSGETQEQAQRRREEKKLQSGLALLEKQLVPSGTTIVLGTIPDMRPCDPRILAPSWIPPKATIDWANAEIAKFAKKHPNVHLYPLGERAERMRSNRFLIENAGEQRSADVAGLLQVDLLHTTRLGAAVLANDLLQWIGAQLPETHPCHPGAVGLVEVLEVAKAKEDFEQLPVLETAK